MTRVDQRFRARGILHFNHSISPDNARLIVERFTHAMRTQPVVALGKGLTYERLDGPHTRIRLSWAERGHR